VPDTLNLGTVSTAANSVSVDWASIALSGFPAANVHYPSDPWPTPAQWSNPTFWPVVLVQGDFSLPNDGRGLLAVTGNLTFAGSHSWDGIVLVGGAVKANGSGTVRGSIISGLNAKLSAGGPAIPDSVHGNFSVSYHSCDVTNALGAFTGLTAYQNATVDNWPNY
jgi:hypothetical protein